MGEEEATNRLSCSYSLICSNEFEHQAEVPLLTPLLHTAPTYISVVAANHRFSANYHRFAYRFLTAIHVWLMAGEHKQRWRANFHKPPRGCTYTPFCSHFPVSSFPSALDIMALYALLFLISHLGLVACLPANNTNSLPPGASNHGDPKLICTATSWTDVATFFIGNYVAHIATARSLPSEPLLSKIVHRIIALFVPSYGLLRGITLITSLAILGKTELDVAARAASLYMVTRSMDWKPEAGDRIENLIIYNNGRQDLEQQQNRKAPLLTCPKAIRC